MFFMYQMSEINSQKAEVVLQIILLFKTFLFVPAFYLVKSGTYSSLVFYLLLLNATPIQKVSFLR